MNGDGKSEEDHIASMAPNVIAVLSAKGFFEALDEVLCPLEESKPVVPCRSNYENSERILTDLGFDAADVEDIFDVLRSRGGACDCEILYNVAETSRVKSKYWRAQAYRHERRGE